MKTFSRKSSYGKKDIQPSLGLVLSAGGARGAYQIGCWRAFRERGLSFGAVSGSSIGSLNGALVCQGDWESAYDLWMQLTKSNLIRPDYAKIGKLAFTAAVDIGLLFVPVPNLRLLRLAKYATSAIKIVSKHGSLGMLRQMGLFNLKDLKPLFGNYIDMSRVLSGKIPLFVTACGPVCQTDPVGELRYFRLQEHDEEQAWSILSASMSIPFLFAGVPINGEMHSDGGIRASLPVEPLYNAGFRTMIAVGMKSSLKLKPQDYPDCRIIVINPDKDLGRFPLATFRFTEQAVMEWMSLGYMDAHRELDKQRIFF